MLDDCFGARSLNEKWSFSNNLKEYLWGKKLEKDKLRATRALFYGDTNTALDTAYNNAKSLRTIHEKYQCFHNVVNDIKKKNINLKSINKFATITHLARMQQLLDLEQLERVLSVKNISSKLKLYCEDYQTVKINSNDVVYCDPPYINTSENYGGFDFKRFHDWYVNCPFDVYISEYTVLPDTEVYKELGKKQSFTSSGKRKQELLLKVKH